MTTNAYPTLTPQGWLVNPAEKIDAALAHCFAAHKSQTALYGDNVTSIQWLLEQYRSDISDLCMKMRQALSDFLNRYFDAVDVDVISDTSSDPSASKINLRISITFFQDGKQYSAGKLLHTQNGKLAGVFNIINYGTTS